MRLSLQKVLLEYFSNVAVNFVKNLQTERFSKFTRKSSLIYYLDERRIFVYFPNMKDCITSGRALSLCSCLTVTSNYIHRGVQSSLYKMSH